MLQKYLQNLQHLNNKCNNNHNHNHKKVLFIININTKNNNKKYVSHIIIFYYILI